jgi:hypothetical protein
MILKESDIGEKLDIYDIKLHPLLDAQNLKLSIFGRKWTVGGPIVINDLANRV